MARSIDRELEAPGDLFVAVGVLHVVGAGSVVEELSAKGYAVERVPPTGERISLPAATAPAPSPPPRPVVGHRIDLPAPVQQQSTTLANGQVHESEIARGDGVAYIATVQAVPPMSGLPMTGFLFDAIEYGFVVSTQAEVERREEIRVDGLPARVTTLRAATLWLRILLVRGDDEIYVVAALVPQGVEPDEYTQTQIQDVFSTFHPRFGDQP